MEQRVKLLVKIGIAYLLYSMVYHGAYVSIPLFLVMLARVAKGGWMVLPGRRILSRFSFFPFVSHVSRF